MSPSTLLLPLLLPLLLLLLLLPPVTSMFRLFWGGSLTFTPKGRNTNGSFMVEFRLKEAFVECSQSNSLSCYNGDCGSYTYTSGTIYNNNNKSPYYNKWCQTEGVMTRTVSSNSPFEMRTGHDKRSWRLWTYVDLGKRSDTNEPNRSPITTSITILSVPRNCPRTYNLMAFDPDNDQVRCRYGIVPETECNKCKTYSAFELNETSCTLLYDGNSRNGNFLIELVLEDFPRQQIALSYTNGSEARRGPSTPLSKIPLNFNFEVDRTVPSCDEGMYLPRFLPPTPGNGERLHAAVNQELEIRVKANASHSTVDDVIISGPVNITRHMITPGEFAIRWTPIMDDLGNHFPICFIAKSGAGTSFYQSEMRCVIVDVGRYSNISSSDAVRANVICTENNMIVSLAGLREDGLRLNDPSCTLYSNGTHVLANISLNTCGTVVEEDEESLIFRNEIVSSSDTSDVIIRSQKVEIEFYCKYPKKFNVTLEFNAHRPAHTFVQKGFGTFTYQFEFFDTDQFHSRKDPNSYPLEYSLGEMIYVEIESTSSLNNMELFAESCSATPNDDPNYHISYSIIEHGCKKDETVQFYSNHESKVKFGMKAFKFIGQHEQVFITCSVILCEAGNPTTRCSQGCQPPAVIKRPRREAPIQTATHYISQGPLRLRRSADGSAAIQSLNLNLVFIAGCLLAAVAMMCGVVFYKTRGPKVKYQPLPTSGI